MQRNKFTSFTTKKGIAVDTKDFNATPFLELKHINLKQSLEKVVLDLELQPHEKFYSESWIMENYSVSLSTVRRCLAEMEKEGQIYRLPKKGTFLSPRRKPKLYLVVNSFDNPTFSESLMSILVFITQHGQKKCSQNLTLAVSEREFLERLNDIEIRYPDLGGVLFYRKTDALLKSFQVLEKKGIASYYYGSNAYERELAFASSVKKRFYREEDIVSLALDKLISLGHKKIGCVFFDMPGYLVSRKRFELFTHYLIEHNLPLNNNLIFRIPSFDYYKEFQKDLLKVKGEFSALFCCSAQTGCKTIQSLEVIGLDIPTQVSVIAQGEGQIVYNSYPALSSIEFPFEQDIIELLNLSDDKSFEENSYSRLAVTDRGSLAPYQEIQ